MRLVNAVSHRLRALDQLFLLYGKKKKGTGSRPLGCCYSSVVCNIAQKLGGQC